MSRMPYLIDAEDARWGHKMGNFTLVDAMYRDGFTCSLCGMIMGETAELLAREYEVTREASDAYAFETQRRAAQAIAEGRFKAEMAPVTTSDAKDRPIVVDTDEHPRPDTTVESLEKLAPVFPSVEGLPGIITAGTSSGITDGGAAVVLMSAARAAALHIPPLVRIIGWASTGVDPRRMGIGPVPAMRKLFRRTGLTLADFDLVELNEAFAAQVLAVLRDEPVPSEKLNVNGGAIALGHPIGCTGTRIIVTLVHEMRRRGARRGLATLCVSGGMGMAMALELTQ
jgi:acetyl-CoA C-acetyltransferase